ncbi:MAG: carbohydrate porin [Cyanobacteriota bacterium]|nr:carbohydrate porin [Cyanobacteriota bacterium]
MLSNNFTAGFGYFGGHSGEPLFGGTYQTGAGSTRASQATIAQLSFWPTPQTKTLGFTFTYGKLNIPQGTPFGVTAQTGTALADQPFGSAAVITPPGNVALLTNTGMNADTYGLGFGWHLGGNLYLIADSSYIQVTATTNGLDQRLATRSGDRAGIFQWNAALSLNNLGGDGNVATFLVGNPYRVVSYSSDQMNTQNTLPWHLELSYTYRLTDNISLVPGFYYILNPEANSNNPPLGVFSFKSFIAF